MSTVNHALDAASHVKRAPRAGSKLWVYGVVGFAQGLALWALQRAVEQHRWPGTPGPWLGALIYAALALPLAWYLAQGLFADERRRAAFAAALAMLFALLGAHSGASWVTRSLSIDTPGHVVASGMLGFILVSLVGGFDRTSRRFSYPRLFELTWRNALLIPVAALLTGVLWLILLAGSWLMQIIGLAGLRQLLGLPSVAFLVTCSGFGMAIGLTLARADTLLALRRFWLSLTAWFAPLAIAFAVAWVCALPFTGLQGLFDTHSSAWYLFCFTTLTVTFVNAAFQDGQEPPSFPAWLATVLSWAWLALVPLVLLGDWALWQRVEQHGWTPARIWGAAAGTLVTVHVIGYGMSMLDRSRWMSNLPVTNITVALLLVALLGALISPIADVRRLAVASQVSRLTSGSVDFSKFDWAFLRAGGGPYGMEALHALADQPGTGPATERIRQRAAQELRVKRRPDPLVLQDEKAAMATLRHQMAVHPPGAKIEESLFQWLARPTADWGRTCLGAPQNCALWIVDLDDDHKPEALLLSEHNGFVQATLYANGPDGWRKQGTMDPSPNTLTAWTRAIDAGQIGRATPRWPDLSIDGATVFFRR